jgi:L-cysteine:1D-myo-inositol 2-amino-2-deoxy-alpha-D-glucopyranoside ligase
VSLRLRDTAAAAVVPFEPPDREVRIYVCGITPYDSTHLGHALTYLTHDLVVRRLEDLGHEVTMVRNFTDVDDSILPKARQLGVNYLDLAADEIARFRSDMEVLGTRPAAHEPRATESVEWMVELIEVLLAEGHAYTVDGFTYYDVSTFPRFGELSGYGPEQMEDLARERGGRPDDPRQRHPLDFVLWMPSAADEPVWESPVGPGRPGWHIECSAMSMRLLGPSLDLHGGGRDLIFPHHECEIAQSEAITGQAFARHWLHVGMLGYEGEKMSKSKRNLVFVSDLVKQHDPRAIRIALLDHHYSRDSEWRDAEIVEAGADLDRWVTAAARPGGPEPVGWLDQVRAAIDDDLDTPRARRLLGQFAGAVLEGGDHSEAPTALARAAALCGVDITMPVA